jgi:hypothetical protein
MRASKMHAERAQDYARAGNIARALAHVQRAEYYADFGASEETRLSELYKADTCSFLADSFPKGDTPGIRGAQLSHTTLLGLQCDGYGESGTRGKSSMETRIVFAEGDQACKCMRTMLLLITQRILLNPGPGRIFGVTNFHYIRRQIKSFEKYIPKKQIKTLLENTLLNEDAFGGLLRDALHYGIRKGNGKEEKLDTPVEWFGVFRLLVGMIVTCEKQVVRAINEALKSKSLFSTEHATAKARRLPNQKIWTEIGCGLAQASEDLPSVSDDDPAYSKFELTKSAPKSAVGKPPTWASSLPCFYCLKIPQSKHVSMRRVCDAELCDGWDPDSVIDIAYGENGIASAIASARGFFMCILKDIVTAPQCDLIHGAAFRTQRGIVGNLSLERHIEYEEHSYALAIIGKHEARAREFITQVLLENAATMEGKKRRLSDASAWLDCMLTMLRMFAECDVELGNFITPLLLRAGTCAELKDGVCQPPCKRVDGKCVRDRHHSAVSRERFKTQWELTGCWRAGLS